MTTLCCNRWDPTTMVFQLIDGSATPLIAFVISTNRITNIVRSLFHRPTRWKIPSRTLSQPRSMFTLASDPCCPVRSTFATPSPCQTTSTWLLPRTKPIWIRHPYWKKYTPLIEISRSSATSGSSRSRRSFNSIKCSARMLRIDTCSRVPFDRFSRWHNARI